jgi:hypothetical protein
MAVEMFKFAPAAVPSPDRAGRKSRYRMTVEAIDEYLAENSDQKSVKIELGSVSSKTAYASFRNVISKYYSDTLRLIQRRGDLYIERR